MARQGFRLKSALCKAVCLFLCLGGLAAYAEDPPVYVSQFGSYGTGNGQFNYPQSIAFDSSGNIYVTDGYNHRVQKFSSSGTYLSQFGNGQISIPVGIALDSSDNIYVAAFGGNYIKKFNSSGTYLSQLGTQGSGNGQFNNPSLIAIDGSGNIWVVDGSNHRVQKFSSSGTYLSQFGTQGTGDGQFNSPRGIAFDSAGNIYVADNLNNRIQKFSSSGTYLSQFGTQGTGNGQFNQPHGIAIDSAGNIYVADYGNSRIQKFSSSGTYLSQFGTKGTGNGQCNSPSSIAIDSSGNIWVGDTNNNRVQKFAYSSSSSIVTRTLPSCYFPGGKITVTITAAPPSGTTNYLVEDTPPSGWTVSDISHSGTYDETTKKVKFGPYFDSTARTLTYNLTSPSTDTGDKTFSGKIFADATTSDIAGQTVISQCSQYHPADTDKNFSLSGSEVAIYGMAWKKETPWAVPPSPVTIAYLTRAGSLWQNGEAYKIDTSLGDPPLCWVNKKKRSERDEAREGTSAGRELSETCLTGQPFTVTVSVSPADTVTFYAVEEEIPPGLTVSVSDPGFFVEGSRKVKFGPFVDHEARTLSYTITPAVSGDFTLKGTASFDGIDLTISGNDTATAAGDINSSGKADLADAVLAMKISAGYAETNANLNADMDGDGQIGIADAVSILQKLSM